MNKQRILTAVIGLPIVVLTFVFANKYVIDVIFAIIAIIAMHEYFNAIKTKAKPISWIGYALAVCIAFIHVVNLETILLFLCIAIPTLLLILFLHIIATDMKYDLKDVAFSLLGILYIIYTVTFIPLIYGLSGSREISVSLRNTSFIEESFKTTTISGRILIGVLVISTWGSDAFAYTIGKHFGKHKFSKISPNKTIEGCIAGVIGAIILIMIYTFLINKYANLELSYLLMGIIAFILSILGEIGDLVESTIKRYCEIKDSRKFISRTWRNS